MAPRPENLENDEAYGSSTCSEDDCAQLVKPGQLDTFTQYRKEKIEKRLQRLHQECDETYGSGALAFNPNPNPPSQQSSERGRPPVPHRTRYRDRRAKSNTRLAIDIGDQVIVKEKYRGTCRYVGPLQEKYIIPDIFIGIELDQPLTNNSGIFGSRQYFDCPYGYGLMVSADKVRKLDSKMENQFDKKPARRSKSVADLTRLLNTRNWFDDERQVKVSPGYKTLNRSKSSSSLNNPLLLEEAHPREVLNKIKRYQPHFITGSDYGYPSFSQGQYHTMPNLRRGQSSTDQYGLPLQYPTGSHSMPREEVLYSEGDLLRQSFARIVVPSMSPPPVLQHFPSYLNYPNTYPTTAANESATTFNSSLYETRSDSGFNQFEPEMQRFNSTNFDSSKTSRTSSEEQHRSFLEWYRALPLCETCAACPTCGLGVKAQTRRTAPPQRLNSQTSQQMPSDQVFFHQPEESRDKPPAIPPKHRKPIPQMSSQHGSNVKMSNVRHGQLPLGLMNEYEKWKTKHGLSMGRGMKKGLTKLQYAAHY